MMDHICIHEGDIAKMAEAIKGLKEWQSKQNGTIQRVDDKLDRLQWWLMGQVVALVFLLVPLVFALIKK